MYFTVVDDCYSFVSVASSNIRGLADGRVIYFVKHTQKVLMKKVDTIRKDNQFATLAFMDFCIPEGIVYETSVPYESYENRVAERWQRTISAKARTLLIDANAPDYLWSEAVMCDAYLLKLLPSRSGADGECPYQLFH